MDMFARAGALLAILAIALATACVGSRLPDGATVEHRYYAALADYNQTKRIATAYAEIPETPAEQVRAILEAVEATDRALDEFEAVRRAGDASPANYEQITAVLDFASQKLREYVESQGEASLERVHEAAEGRMMLAGVGLDPAVALLILKVLTIVSAGVKLAPELARRRDEYLERIEVMVAEGRGPTDEEFGELIRESKDLTDRIRAALASKEEGDSGTASPAAG